jgi:hypothetical protein
VGGAIKGVRKIKTETITPDYSTILKHAGIVEYSRPPSDFLKSKAPDMIPKNQYAYFQHTALYHREPELDYHKTLVRSVSGHGAKKDHPIVQKGVIESLKHKPVLLQMYLTGRV